MSDTSIALNFNECGLLLYMFPQQWQGSEKQLDILNEFMPDMEKNIDEIKVDLDAARKDKEEKKITPEEFEAKAKEIGERDCYTLTSGKVVNMIKSEWASRKFPRMFSQTVFALRDKLGLY